MVTEAYDPLSGLPFKAGHDLAETRTVNDHHVDRGGALSNLTVYALRQPGIGGVHEEYAIADGETPLAYLKFQRGVLPEGINGITNEALLSVVIDRLRGFQSGKFACRDNAISLTHIEDALMRLQRRTRDRMARNVEGKYEE